MKKNIDFEIVVGKNPVLLSAPHVYPHRRPRLASKYKQGEDRTDKIVREICVSTNTHGIYALKELEYDPNYYAIGKNTYKKNVRNIVKEQNIQYFFDIHGLSDEYEYDFGIYYLNRYSNSKSLAHDLEKALNKGGLRGCLVQILNIPQGKQESLTEFVASNLKVPSLQIEISRYIRDKDNLRAELIKNFSDFLVTLE